MEGCRNRQFSRLKSKATTWPKRKKVSVVQDESFHWYVIPEKLLPFFRIDEEDYSMIDSGQFDDKWGKYRTGGDLNLVQLYAVIKE